MERELFGADADKKALNDYDLARRLAILRAASDPNPLVVIGRLVEAVRDGERKLATVMANAA